MVLLTVKDKTYWSYRKRIYRALSLRGGSVQGGEEGKEGSKSEIERTSTRPQSTDQLVNNLQIMSSLVTCSF